MSHTKQTNMKTLTIYIVLTLTSLVTFGQNKIVKTFPCHDFGSNIYMTKLKTLDSLKMAGWKVVGFRVDNTFKQKGYNTQVFTFKRISPWKK